MKKTAKIATIDDAREESIKKQKMALQIAAKSQLPKDYLKYVEFVNTSMNPDADWKRGKHLVYVCRAIQEFVEEDTGHAYDVMILNIPPQFGKSTAVTETLPSWYMGNHPDDGVILTSYGEDLAQRFGRRNKEKTEKFGSLVFGIKVSATKNAVDDYEIEGHKGRLIAKGIMAGITGNPAKLLLIDDPIRNKEEANSKLIRDKVWNEWESSIRSRLASGAKIILVMTRWHDDDLAGRMLRTEKNVRYINITCEAEENDILGREVGEGLFPEIGKGTEWKDEMKAAYLKSEGMGAWMSLYQGQPLLESGNVFKRDWFKFYDPADLPVMYQTIMSVDASFKGKDTSDFVAVGVWGKSGTSVYLLDIINERMDFIRTLEIIREFKAKYRNLTMTLIEDKANGSAIISTLQREIMGIVPIEPLGSKESRAYAIQPFVMAGNVYLPRGLAIIEQYIEQMCRFPQVPHDDMVDMTSQALIRLKDFSANAPAGRKKEPPFSVLKTAKSVCDYLKGGEVTDSFLNY